MTELKVDFELTPELEREIRQTARYLGKQGLDELIKAIRENMQPKAGDRTGQKNTVIGSPGTIIDSPGASSNVTIHSPAPRIIPPELKPTIIEALSKVPARVTVSAQVGDSEALGLASDIYDLLSAAKWDMQGRSVAAVVLLGKGIPGIVLRVHGEPPVPGSMIEIEKDEPLGVLALILRDQLHFPVQLDVAMGNPEGKIEVRVGPRE